MVMLADIGIVGMAVMGKNLALNIEHHGYTVAVYNRTNKKVTQLIADYPERNLIGTKSPAEFVASLAVPRQIILMVKAGVPTDETIQLLLPYLDKGDILIDGGNTFFADTMRRGSALDDAGINFIGMGVSGGELGALHGPSLMPGGLKGAYDLVAPILEQIAARTPDDVPCVTYIGTNGSGHYVKMVHNGIEYGDMQLIAETYALMHDALGLSLTDIATVFADWNNGELKSYLIEITSDILTREDDFEDGLLIDHILDVAGNKGTGKWSSQNALELGTDQSLITSAVYVRYLSTIKDERQVASKLIAYAPPKNTQIMTEVLEKLRRALYFAKIMSYA